MGVGVEAADPEEAVHVQLHPLPGPRHQPAHRKLPLPTLITGEGAGKHNTLEDEIYNTDLWTGCEADLMRHASGPRAPGPDLTSP